MDMLDILGDDTVQQQLEKHEGDCGVGEQEITLSIGNVEGISNQNMIRILTIQILTFSYSVDHRQSKSRRQIARAVKNDSVSKIESAKIRNRESNQASLFLAFKKTREIRDSEKFIQILTFCYSVERKESKSRGHIARAVKKDSMSDKSEIWEKKPSIEW